MARRKNKTASFNGRPGPAAERLSRTGRTRESGKPKRDRYKGALYDPTRPLAGKQLGKAVDALVGLEFGSRRKALKREQANTTTQGLALVDRAGSYYTDLAKSVAGDVERQQAIGTRLQQGLQTAQDRSTQALDASAADVDRRMGADEQVRGQGLDGGADGMLASELAAQRAAAASQAQAQQTNAAEGTADYERLADLTSRSTAARGGEMREQLLTRLANQQTELRGQGTDLETEAAGRRTEQLVGMRGRAFEDLVTLEGLGIKRADLQAQVQSDRADRRLASRKVTQTERQNRRAARLQRRGQNVTARGQDLSADTQRRGQDVTVRGQDLSAQQRAEDRASRERVARARKDGTRLESADAKKLKQGIANAVVDLGDDPKLNSRTPAEQARILRRRGAPAIVIRAARERASGGLNVDTAKELRRLGLRIPREWLRGRSGYNKGNRPG